MEKSSVLDAVPALGESHLQQEAPPQPPQSQQQQQQPPQPPQQQQQQQQLPASAPAPQQQQKPEPARANQDQKGKRPRKTAKKWLHTALRIRRVCFYFHTRKSIRQTWAIPETRLWAALAAMAQLEKLCTGTPQDIDGPGYVSGTCSRRTHVMP